MRALWLLMRRRMKPMWQTMNKMMSSFLNYSTSIFAHISSFWTWKLFMAWTRVTAAFFWFLPFPLWMDGLFLLNLRWQKNKQKNFTNILLDDFCVWRKYEKKSSTGKYERAEHEQWWNCCSGSECFMTRSHYLELKMLKLERCLYAPRWENNFRSQRTWIELFWNFCWMRFFLRISTENCQWCEQENTTQRRTPLAANAFRAPSAKSLSLFGGEIKRFRSLSIMQNKNII